MPEKKMTNLEWIKGLSKEQVAHLITDYANDCCQGCIITRRTGMNCTEGDKTCVEMAMDWLDEEHKEQI